MRNFRVVCLLLSMASPAFAAASHPTSAGDATKTDIVGKWRRACYPSKVFAGEFTDETLEFTHDGSFHREVRRYFDSNCYSTSMKELQDMDGSYAVNTPDKAVDNASDLDLTIAGLYSTATGEEAARAFNKSSYCNVSDWRRDIKRNVAGFPCFGQTLNAGSKIFDVARVDQGRLLLGKKSFLTDGSLASVRPTQLNTDLPFAREGALSH